MQDSRVREFYQRALSRPGLGEFGGRALGFAETRGFSAATQQLTNQQKLRKISTAP